MKIFEEAIVLNVNREKRYRILRTLIEFLFLAKLQTFKQISQRGIFV